MLHVYLIENQRDSYVSIYLERMGVLEYEVLGSKLYKHIFLNKEN